MARYRTEKLPTILPQVYVGNLNRCEVVVYRSYKRSIRRVDNTQDEIRLSALLFLFRDITKLATHYYLFSHNLLYTFKKLFASPRDFALIKNEHINHIVTSYLRSVENFLPTVK